MKKLATIIAAAALAATLAPTSALADQPVAPVALYMANDYTVFTRALGDVIDRNADAVQTATSHDGAREAISGILGAAAENDAKLAHVAGVPAAAASSAATYAPSAPAPSTISMAGQTIPYADSYLSSTAPESGAGLWYGSDSTTDGSFGYFIGHNPGPFSCMLDMGVGSEVTVTDSNGDVRTYTVHDVFDVANTTTWSQISSRVATHGESIVIQCCIQGGAYYRIMVAW